MFRTLCISNRLLVLINIDQGRRATRGGIFRPEIFKTLHSNFDICRNFQIIKLKYCILIIFKKSLIRIFLCLTD